MFKKIFFLFLTVSITLSACGTLEVSMDRTPTPNLMPAASTLAPTLTPAAQPLSMDSSSDVIQQKMLHSTLNWTTLWLDGAITNNLVTPPKTVHQQVWIDQSSARFRFLGGPADGNATKFKVSDGVSTLEMDIPSGATQISAMPGSAAPNLIWGQIGEQLPELAFPADFAQNEGVFKPVAMEIIAGRPTLVVSWTYISNSLPSWRMWLDTQTGVILKMQDFGKSGGDSVQSETIVSSVQYDIPNLPVELFSVNPTVLPAFSDVVGNLLSPVLPGPTVQTGSDPLGEVYFFALTPGDDAGGARLVRFPGSCVVGKQACPAAEQVSLPGKTYANNGPALAWSVDGKKVAFVAGIGNNEAVLYVSAMPIPAWKKIAEFPLLDLPAWSGDGNWISFRVQDGNGNQDYYVVHPDGSGLKNVTASDKLPAEDRPYNVDGWITNNLIVRSGKPGRDGVVNLIRVDDGRIMPLFDTSITKNIFYPSPDGSMLAFDQYNDNSKIHTLRIIAPDGSGLRDLATFKTTIYPITWSPDETSLAFGVYSETPGASSGLYVINRNGRGLKQVYTGSDVMNLAFSPSGQSLLVEGGNQQHIFVVALDTLEVRLLQAPGLTLSDWWRQPAWVP